MDWISNNKQINITTTTKIQYSDMCGRDNVVVVVGGAKVVAITMEGGVSAT